MKIVCAKCSAKIEYDKIGTRIVYKDFADEMAKKMSSCHSKRRAIWTSKSLGLQCYC